MKARPLNKRTSIKYFICDVYGEVFKKENLKFKIWDSQALKWNFIYNRCSCSRDASEKEAKEKFKNAFL